VHDIMLAENTLHTNALSVLNDCCINWAFWSWQKLW